MSGIEGIVAPLVEVSIARSDMPAYQLAWRGDTPGPKTISAMDSRSGYFLGDAGFDVSALLQGGRYLHIVKVEEEISAFISNGIGRPTQILQPSISDELVEAISAVVKPHMRLATLERTMMRQNRFFLTGPLATGSAILDAAAGVGRHAWEVRYVEELDHHHQIYDRRVELVEVLR